VLPALPSNQDGASAQSALKQGIRLGRKINGASLRDSDILLVRVSKGRAWREERAESGQTWAEKGGERFRTRGYGIRESAAVNIWPHLRPRQQRHDTRKEAIFARRKNSFLGKQAITWYIVRCYEDLIGSLRIDWINRIERSGWLQPRRLVVLDEARGGIV
jgi:hypothetical protein